jgi:cytochrome c
MDLILNHWKRRLMRNPACLIPGSFWLCALAFLMAAFQARAAGDPKAGLGLYAQECADCHSITPGKNKKGPSLFGIVGKKAASVPGFSYSQALQQAGFIWTAERLDTYIANPRRAVPGGKMKYDGLDDARDRADLIAYLMTLH